VDGVQDDNDLVAGSSDITNKADIILKYSRCDFEKYGCDSLIKVTKNRLLGTLRTTNESAVKVNYDDCTRRVTGISEEEQAERLYGWQLGLKELKAPSKVSDPLDLPF
jgi:hypothetical protein